MIKITKVYAERLPAVRMIGKKYADKDRDGRGCRKIPSRYRGAFNPAIPYHHEIRGSRAKPGMTQAGFCDSPLFYSSGAGTLIPPPYCLNNLLISSCPE